VIVLFNEYFYDLAKIATRISGIPTRWIYCQWYHETGGFTSELCVTYNNLGGITTANPTELEKSMGQPDGSLWYKCFDTKEGFAEYFGNYLNYFEEDGIKDAVTIREYAEALKHGGYFGDTIDNYAQGMKDVELRCFA